MLLEIYPNRRIIQKLICINICAIESSHAIGAIPQVRTLYEKVSSR
ncbi:hypothetical protein [Helicobacter canis]|nr:hypothetical protein [Helicobacter canis]